MVAADSIANAHPGHSHQRSSTADDSHQDLPSERTWAAASGVFRERGSFVMAREGMVQIRRDDDTLVLLPVSLLEPEDQHRIEHRLAEIRRAAERNGGVRFDHGHDEEHHAARAAPRLGIVDRGVPDVERLVAQLETGRDKANVAREAIPEIASAFQAFVDLKAIRTRWDDCYFYVESNGIPGHPMMIGIRSWQQQVPIPQNYVGDNAWQIPLHPVPAARPRSTNGQFLRGAIAVAVNGIPIFNPLNNRGDDAYLFGELDEYGGHCGRADDYHYHLAPVHLEKTTGKGKPVAYALDGYPIYGYDEADGSPVKDLDAFNGHKDANGNYHYHATRQYPYLNGGFHGEVTERGGQVDPQPRAEPIRPDLRPLRGARITDFRETKPGTYALTYDVNGKSGTVSYTLAGDGSARFVFVDTNGQTRAETYMPGRRGPGDPERPPRRAETRTPLSRDARPPATVGNDSATTTPNGKHPRLVVTSSSVDAKGLLSVACTCDGVGLSPAVAWKNAPEGTKSFAVSLWHTAPDQEKSYWVVYNIPADVTSLPSNSKSIGRIGLNDRRRAEYDPLCSKGPGLKTYHVTVFALSAEPRLAPGNATRAQLLRAIQGITLAEGTLDFVYERKGVR